MIDYHKNTIQSIIIGSVIGSLCYFILFDIKTIMPANIEWYVNLLNDSGQHIIGWLAYINSQYFFPIGLTDYLLYPDKVSIVYSDSLPLLSFLLKPIALIYGAFQYFGLYGLLNFILQGIFAAFIIGRWTNNKIITAIFTVMIVLNPVFLMRIYTHHSLSSQWLILISIAYILQNYNAPLNIKKDIVFWSVLFFIIPGIHFYFFPMVYGLAFMYCLYKYYKNKKVLIFQLILYPAIAVVALFLYGGFYNIVSHKGDYHGEFGANLNTFINPAHIGQILPGMKIGGGQYEGIGYLGFGFILMAFIAIGIVIYKKIKKQNILIEKKKFYFILITLLIYFFVSTGGSGYFNGYKLFYIDLNSVLSTFRSSGRFIWVCVYIIDFILIYLIIKNTYNKKTKYIVPLLLIILCIQIADIYNFLQRKSVEINNSFKNESIMIFNENECKYLKENYEYVHINVISHNDYNIMYPYIYNFIQCGMPVNNFYLARSFNNNQNKKNEIIMKQLADGNLDKILFLNTKDNKLNLKDVYVHSLGNAFLISNHHIPFLDNMPVSFISEKLNKKTISISENKFFTKGWYKGEKTLRWSSANKSQIIIPVGNNINSALVRLKLRPYLNEKMQEQEISISVKNKRLLNRKMDKNYAFYEVIVPKTLIVDNKIILDIELSNKLSSPSAVGRNDGRLLGAAVSHIEYYE